MWRAVTCVAAEAGVRESAPLCRVRQTNAAVPGAARRGGAKNAGPPRRKARLERKSGSHLLSPRRTTIGRSGLNCRVRNGNGCGPARKTTGKSGGAASRVADSRPETSDLESEIGDFKRRPIFDCKERCIAAEPRGRIGCGWTMKKSASARRSALDMNSGKALAGTTARLGGVLSVTSCSRRAPRLRAEPAESQELMWSSDWPLVPVSSRAFTPYTPGLSTW